MQDYYGITFPGPAATLSGRDGSLANNPYSGKADEACHNDKPWPGSLPVLMSLSHSDFTWLLLSQVKSQNLAGMTPPPRRPPLACLPLSPPRARTRGRARASLSRPSPRASHSTTAASRPSCLLATATPACPTTPGYLVLCPVPLPSSMAPLCSSPLGARGLPQPSSTAWVWAWETPRPAPSSSRPSSSPAATASTPSAQVSDGSMHTQQFT